MRVAVVGGGISGLTFSLLAARAGHDVVVIDRDPPREDGDVESAWDRWDRRSVPQFRQIHGYQAVAHSVLRERLPDVLALLHRAGARDASRVGTALGAARYRNLLDPPAAFWSDEHIAERVRAAIIDGAPPITLDSPSRSDIDA